MLNTLLNYVSTHAVQPQHHHVGYSYSTEGKAGAGKEVAFPGTPRSAPEHRHSPAASLLQCLIHGMAYFDLHPSNNKGEGFMTFILEIGKLKGSLPKTL
jgi:hypothetical protein